MDNSPNDEQAAFDAALELMAQAGELGKGYSSTGENKFSWMHHVDPESWDSLDDVLEAWRLPPTYDDEGNIDGVRFTGQKIGQEDLLFERMEPHVEYDIEFRLETGERREL